MILIQDLLLYDPADKVPLRMAMDFYKHNVPRCTMDSSLESMFELFRKGNSHLAFVYKKKETDTDGEQLTIALSRNGESSIVLEEAVGILTLENIIEELVQSEIMDEADNRRERRKQSI
jgi:metal transporter CNNM